LRSHSSNRRVQLQQICSFRRIALSNIFVIRRTRKNAVRRVPSNDQHSGLVVPRCKSVSRSLRAKGLRRRACTYFRPSCHAIPISWFADGFAGSSPITPATQSSAANGQGADRRWAKRISAARNEPDSNCVISLTLDFPPARSGVKGPRPPVSSVAGFRVLGPLLKQLVIRNGRKLRRALVRNGC
jgi:hypothetical protein